jgi:hypothetical protein
VQMQGNVTPPRAPRLVRSNICVARTPSAFMHTCTRRVGHRPAGVHDERVIGRRSGQEAHAPRSCSREPPWPKTQQRLSVRASPARSD